MSYPTYEIERGLLASGYTNIVGIDEVGRGCGAGPVVATAVHIPSKAAPLLLGKVKDSKKLSAKKREELCDLIMDTCVYAYEGIDNKTIDDINILNATKLAMAGALSKLYKKKSNLDHVVVDGPLSIDTGGIDQTSIIDGDALCLSVAAASIIAKVVRDNIMISLHSLYPEYGWETNKGYLTKTHIEALRKKGPTEFHRLSFNKVG